MKRVDMFNYNMASSRSRVAEQSTLDPKFEGSNPTKNSRKVNNTFPSI
jgi:hypothetical protein